MDFGIVFEHRSVRICTVDPDSPAGRMGLRRGDRLTHIGGIPVCNRDQIAATWLMLGDLPRDDITVLRKREVLRIPILPGLEHATFAPDFEVDDDRTWLLDLRDHRVVAAGIAS